MANIVVSNNQKLTATDVERICSIENIEKTTKLTDRNFFNTTYNEIKINKLQSVRNFPTILGLVFTKIATLSGISKPIDDFVKQDITRLVLRRYKHLSMSEVYKAFENERYGINNPKTEHYQLFDSNYVATIIDKYVLWRQNEKQKTNWQPPKPQQTIALPVMSDKEKHERMTKEINRLFTTYILQGNLNNQITIHVYQELRDRGIILTKSDNPKTQERLDNYFAKQYQKAKQQIQQEAKQKARLTNSSYYRQVLSEIENKPSGAILAQMQRNILCQLFEKNRNNKDFFNLINN